MTTLRRVTAWALGALVLAGVLATWGGESQAASPSRTVVVADSAKPLPADPRLAALDCIGRPRTCRNGANGLTLAYSLKGRVPRTPMLATVLTDVNCEPDRYGISHCLNELRLLGDGRRITVRHDHNMHEFSCLTPGERVRVLALDVALRR